MNLIMLNFCLFFGGKYSRFLLIFAFFYPVMQGLSQEKITTSKLLSGQSASVGSTLLDDNLKFLKEAKQKMPVISETELRTETDEWEPNSQEYMMRFSFNTRRSRKVQNKINQNKVQLYELKSRIAEEANLVNRYELIVDWYYNQAELEYLEEKKIVKEDAKVVYQKMLANSVALNIEDLLKVDADIQKLDRKVLQLNLEKEYIIQQLLPQLGLTTHFELDSTNWISLETMNFVLNQVKDTPTLNFEQVLQETETDFEQLEFDMEKAKSRQIVDFIQVKYAGKEDLAVPKELSLGIGLKIPVKSSARIKLNERRLDIFDEQYKQELQQAKLQKKVATYYATFDAVFKEHQLIQQQISESQLEQTLNKYSASGAVQPLSLLRMSESVLNNKQSLGKLEKDACQLFLKILEEKGLLSQSPFINYLSDDLRPF